MLYLEDYLESEYRILPKQFGAYWRICPVVVCYIPARVPADVSLAGLAQ